MIGNSVGRVLSVVAVGALITTAVYIPLSAEDYQVTAVMPGGNPNLEEGVDVFVDGFPIGTMDSVRPEDNSAVMTISIDDEAAPLREGAEVMISWKGTIGERVLNIEDGPEGAAEIPDGSMLEGEFLEPTEIGDVLNALDEETRAHLQPLVEQMDDTVDGQEENLQATLNSAGPALSSLGDVLRGIGTDGPAIEQLVNNTNELVTVAGARSAEVEQVVSGLSENVSETVAQREALQQALSQLPATLDTTEAALGEVPETTDEAIPLLEDLAAATDNLPSVSDNLAGVLADARPLVSELRPTLESASVLLDDTPALLDSADGALPGTNTAAEQFNPALDFLSDYTPEAVGFLTTWGSAGQNFDSNGRYMRIYGQSGPAALNTNPGVTPPGLSQDKEPAPGVPGGNDRDAHGEGMN